MEQGLSRMAYKPELYASMLRKFVASQEHVMAQIAHCLQAADQATAERLAHTLRGIAGNLGASALQLSAERLETALRTGAAAAPLFAAQTDCAACLDRLLDALRKAPGLLQPEHAVAPQDLTPAQRLNAQTVITQIREMLAENNPDAQDLWAAHAPVLRQVCGNAAKIETAMAAFEFEEVLQLL